MEKQYSSKKTPPKTTALSCAKNGKTTGLKKESLWYNPQNFSFS